VTIEDDGPGLPADGIVDGLGLSIVRTIITQDLRGSLTISAREGGGTIARVSIPMVSQA
jgi:signal transduction histidine kinase